MSQQANGPRTATRLSRRGFVRLAAAAGVAAALPVAPHDAQAFTFPFSLPFFSGGADLSDELAAANASIGAWVAAGDGKVFFASEVRGGMCAAPAKGGAAKVVYAFGDNYTPGSARPWAVHKGRLYFSVDVTVTDPDSASAGLAGSELHSMKTDGSDDRVVYTTSYGSTIAAAYLYDDQLYVSDDYVIPGGLHGRFNEYTHGVYRMGLDGSDAQQVNYITCSGRLNSMLITPHRVFTAYIPLIETGDEAWYNVADTVYEDSASLYQVSLDDKDDETGYEVLSFGQGMMEAFAWRKERLYFVDGGALYETWASGSHERELYAGSVGTKLCALTDDMIYLLVPTYGEGGPYAEAESWSLVGVPYDFESPLDANGQPVPNAETPVRRDGITWFNPTGGNTGEGVFVLGGTQDPSSAGAQACVVSYDGKKLTELEI